MIAIATLGAMLTGCTKEGGYQSTHPIAKIYCEERGVYSTTTDEGVTQRHYVTPRYQAESWVWEESMLSKIYRYDAAGTCVGTDKYTYEGTRLMKRENGDWHLSAEYEYDWGKLSCIRCYQKTAECMRYDFERKEGKKISAVEGTFYSNVCQEKGMDGGRSLLGLMEQEAALAAEEQPASKDVRENKVRLELKWDGDNIKEAKLTLNGTWRWTRRYAYDGKENPFRGFWGWSYSYGEGVAELGSANNVTSESWETPSGKGGEYRYEYEYDGTVPTRAMRICESDGNGYPRCDSVIYEYEYTR